MNTYRLFLGSYQNLYPDLDKLIIHQSNSAFYDVIYTVDLSKCRVWYYVHNHNSNPKWKEQAPWAALKCEFQDGTCIDQDSQVADCVCMLYPVLVS